MASILQVSHSTTELQGRRSPRVSSENQALGFNKAGEVSPFGSHSPFTFHTLLNLEEPDISRPSNSHRRYCPYQSPINSRARSLARSMGMYLCLGIEPSIHVCYPPVITNRLPEVW